MDEINNSFGEGICGKMTMMLTIVFIQNIYEYLRLQ